MSLFLRRFAPAMLIVAISGLLVTCAMTDGEKQLTAEELVARGQYLVTIGNCNDCHSPKRYDTGAPVPDPALLLSGHQAGTEIAELPQNHPNAGGWTFLGNAHFTAWASPWGIAFAANLTPDSATGLGTWTEDDFIKTLRSGKHKGSDRMILPPMPWQFIGKMSDQDLKAIYAYLRSLPPVSNQVPSPIPPQEPGTMNEAGLD